MPELDLTLTLIDDVVASERPATEGGHASLDYRSATACPVTWS